MRRPRHPTLSEGNMPDKRITTSMVGAVNTCARLARYAYFDGLRPKDEPEYFRTGSAFHHGMELHGQGGSLESALCGVYNLYAEAVKTQPSREMDLWYECARVCAMVGEYIRLWDDDAANYEIVAAEKVFDDVPIVNPATNRPTPLFVLAGKIDKLIKIRGYYAAAGSIAVMEHKTTAHDISEPDSPYIQRLIIDSQASNYVIAAETIFGTDIAGVLYDIVHKPAQRPKMVAVVDDEGAKIVFDREGNRVRRIRDDGWRKSEDKAKGYLFRKRRETPGEYATRVRAAISEDPSRYFRRLFLARTEADLEDAKSDLWQAGSRIRDSIRSGAWPRNDKACLMYGKCAYFDICTGGGWEPGQKVPDGFEVVDDIHTELVIDETV